MNVLRRCFIRCLLAVVAVTGFGMWSSMIHAQKCHSSTSSGVRFEARGDTVVDHRNGLLWRRCSLGQQWDNAQNQCIGEAAVLSLRQARKQITRLNQKQTVQWRLPDIYELSALAELRCKNPAIDLTLFPNTTPAHYWTSTAFANRQAHYWLVQFATGGSHVDAGKRLAHVRLVKTYED